MYRIEVKPTAVRANPAVRQFVEDRDTVVECESRAAAETLATELSDGGGRVRIQTAAPQDPSSVDGYLVRFPKRSRTEPKASSKPGSTFDVGANLYGALGRALIVGDYGVSPALSHYFFDEPGHHDREVHRLCRVSDVSLGDRGVRVSWVPDCVIGVRRSGTGDVIAEYFCEIKTGAASFQRGQRSDMKTAAETVAVLKIRVDIGGLPDEFTVRIDRIGPG